MTEPTLEAFKAAKSCVESMKKILPIKAIALALDEFAQRTRAEALKEAACCCNAVDVTLSAAGMAVEIRDRIRALIQPEPESKE